MSKIEAVIFDMDGVLIDARDWHFLALNEALKPFGYEITSEDHRVRFDGLSTKKKLEILSSERGLPVFLHSMISNVKQDRTLRFSALLNFPSVGLQILLRRLQQKGIRTGVVTNSVRQTTEVMLRSAGILNIFDVVVTNEDIAYPKPSPLGYQLACEKLQLPPNKVLVVEDGDYGAEAAAAAGCHVLRVKNPSEVNLGLLFPYIPELL